MQLDLLLGYDRTRRQLLWEKYTIQLIKWERESKRYEGWRLKGNWEFKIDFLEQIYILGRDSERLPRLWLEKWERKQQQQQERQKVSEIVNVLNTIDMHLGVFHRMEWKPEFEDMWRWRLSEICDRSKTVRELLSNFQNR